MKVILIMAVLYLIFSSIPLAWYLITVIYPRYKLYQHSSYKDETGVKFHKLIFDKGLYGEFLIFIELEKLTDYKKKLSNLYLDKGKGTTEVDLVMINQYGIYVIESKNFTGKVYGDDRNKNWTQYIKGKKYNFYNPVNQNNIHVNALLRTLNIPKNNFTYSYIVFGDKSDLKKVSISKPNVKLLQTKDISDNILINQKNIDKQLSIEEIDEIYLKLRKYAFADEKVKEQHIFDIRNKYR